MISFRFIPETNYFNWMQMILLTFFAKVIFPWIFFNLGRCYDVNDAILNGTEQSMLYQVSDCSFAWFGSLFILLVSLSSSFKRFDMVPYYMSKLQEWWIANICGELCERPFLANYVCGLQKECSASYIKKVQQSIITVLIYWSMADPDHIKRN